MNREGRVIQFIVAQLRADAPLVAIVGDSIGPLGSLPTGKAVTYDLESAEAITPTYSDAAIIGETFTYAIEAWGDSWSDVALIPIADGIDRALEGKAGTVNGVRIESMGMAASLGPTSVDGQRVSNRLGRRFRFEATGP